MKRLLFILFVVTTSTGFAQEMDSVVTLSEVNIIDQRLKEYSTGSRVEEIGEDRMGKRSHSSLTDLLRSNSAVSIRSYGLSGLSTISLRGMGSSHSAILWEGINLQSSANGSVDLTLLPVSFVDKVALQYGGGSTLFGSGAIGGAIHLSGHQYEFSKPISISAYQQAGSFGSIYSGVNLAHSGKNYSIKLRAFTKKAENDFQFFNEYTQKNEVQDNAQLAQDGVMLEGFYKFRSNQFISKYWIQGNLIHLPKTKGQGLPAVKFQKDEFHRAMLQWQHKTRKIGINVKTAFLWHELIYINRQSNTLANTVTESLIAEAVTDYALNTFWKIQLGINHTFETAEVDGYRGFIPERHRTAFFSSLKGLLFDKLETTLSIRESYNDQNWSPFLPSLGLRYQISSAMALKAKASKNYRIPTFNDLHWWQGGNPDLLPERSLSFEIGGEYAKGIDKISVKNELTIFSNYVNDWILWAPLENSVWSPKNIQEVWSKGIELENNVAYRINNKISMNTSIGYQLTDTRVEVIFTEKQNIIGNQMMLTPIHKANFTLNVEMNTLSFGLKGSYTGEQFTDDNSNRAILDDFTTWDLSIDHQLKLSQKNMINIGADLNNILNHRYDVRRGYPMPGRNFNLRIKYQFN